MSSNDSKIQPLPPDVVAKLKSSTAITHLNGVIVELVKNALDADARIIYVTVDFLRGGCVVEDDGDGIPPAEFEPAGGLGKAHHTSKYHTSQSVYGRRGLFLASLSALSLLTITSHHARHPSTNTVTFHHSTPVARLMPVPVYQELRFSNHGTSVTVNDLFGNMPVRVKSRALALQRPDELVRQWDELRQLLVSFMVTNDRMVKLVVSDLHREKRLIVHPQTRVRPQGGELDLQRIRSILAQSGLIEAQNTGIWDVVSASVADFAVHAAISLIPSPTKKVQFVSLGPDPVFARNNANLIYTEVNRIFSLSDFGTIKGSSSFSKSGDGADGESVHSKPTSKAVNKWPMFYIRINTRDAWGIDDEGQDLPDSERSLQRIIDVLATMMNEFLKQRGLRPRARKRTRGTPGIPPATTSPSNLRAKRPLSPECAASSTEEAFRDQLKLPSFRKSSKTSHHFGDWTRIKSAKKDTTGKRLPLRNLESDSTPQSDNNPLRIVKDHLDQEPALPSEQGGNEGSTIEPISRRQELGMRKEVPNGDQEASEVDTMIPWVDPYTGRSHLINSRTGQSLLIGPSVELGLTLRPRSTGSLRAPNLALDGVKRPRSAALGRTENKWVENLLDNWVNPVFGRPEKPISAMDPSGHEATRPGSSSHDNRSAQCRLDNMGVSKFRGKLRKQDLRTAEIIAQVDQKFILTKMQTSPSHPLGDPTSSLILIDQHAADERCRVEHLLAELFASSDSPDRIQTIQLEPIIFEIPATEASLFGRYREFFQSWGVDYTVEQGPGDINVFIFVSTLPTLIAERCRAEPHLVTDLIRGEIWRREEENGRSRQGLPAGLGDRADMEWDKRSWVDRLDGCPRGIIDLLNSRACRTAIMFNDVLDSDECQSLVRRLADCVFPFQCAHGRPSMIPILDMGAMLDQSQSDEYEGPGFVDAFKGWQDGKAD
ncbi:DNA mismatch repair protein [Aspergillus sclerotioniger CBS 115572]|uniref:DNA mismatch repair protein n=1 Tax=Aspergillus sclerotioniger CBS 115572 TaxID=1450535 RepID=A0A317X6J0_9EURO|nr:DNA mismatch repair protein [Aspergillus sclerotioniger CBS 115572]PWY93771.1 DNA mismatch repair protein [Aspergillus sclerotioniger CBS 115572]